MAQAWTSAARSRGIVRLWRPAAVILVLAVLVGQGLVIIQLRKDLRSQTEALATQNEVLTGRLSEVEDALSDLDSDLAAARTAIADVQAGLMDARTFSNQMVEWAEAVNEGFQTVWNAIGAASYDDPLNDTVYLDCYEYTSDYLTCTGS